MKAITFNKDFHPEFEGWICEEGKGVWISFISSKDRGKGNFRRLIQELKNKYDWIRITTPSVLMREIGLKYNFECKYEYQPTLLESCEILIWEKQNELSKL